ncbi:MAG: metal-dependent hydrolase [Chitinophagaceae bacterium]|nr:metal-dependent hydrolase [Chitinophagaceae bacterium]
MDSITHIVLGAAIGEAFAGKKLGKRAMFLGAVAQSLPDIDFVAGAWNGTAENLLAHRGFTHSFLFILLMAPVLGLVAERWHRPHNISLLKWSLFFGVNALIHVLIDGMNSYGTGWFEPFSHARISYNWIFVADPFFSVWLAIGFIMLLVLRKKSPRRIFWVRFGILLSSIYLLYCVSNKWQTDRAARHSLAVAGIHYSKYFTTPTALNNWLWYIVAASDSGYYIGYRSVFDKKKEIDFHFYPRNEKWLEPVKDEEDLQRLLRFAQGYYTVEKEGEDLVFNDLRFGQVNGWDDLKAPFVFHYYLGKEGSNDLVIQKGRFSGLNARVLGSLIRRIKGE